MSIYELRHRIYKHFANCGAALTATAVAELVGDATVAQQMMRQLHNQHVIVLDDQGEIVMALPFSARPSGHRVVDEKQAWWANCAWDALAIPVALQRNGVIDATWIDTGEPVDITICDGALTGGGADGYIQVMVPASRWWVDIAWT